MNESLPKLKRDTRLDLLITCFEEFKSIMEARNPGMKIEYKSSIPEICKEINDFHWEFIAFIKDSEILKSEDSNNPNANFYKIISATEWAIFNFQPVQGDESIVREINAELIVFVSQYIFNKAYDLDPSIFQNDIWSKFIKDRKSWFSSFEMSAAGFPVFLNSQIWMLAQLYFEKK